MTVGEGGVRLLGGEVAAGNITVERSKALFEGIGKTFVVTARVVGGGAGERR